MKRLNNSRQVHAQALHLWVRWPTSSTSRPPTSPYGPAAIRTYANELAQTYGKDGIGDVISPGAVWFEGGSWDKQKQENPKFYQAVERSIPLGD